MRLLRAAVIVLSVAVAVLLLVVRLAASGAWDRIDHRAAPRVTGADNLYFALNDMDAQAANLLLSSGGRGGLAPMPAQHAAAQRMYTASRHTISASLQTLAASAQGDRQATATVVGFDDDFARYQELVGRALENDLHPAEKSAALGDYRTATDLLRQSLLPAAQRLGQNNDGAFEDTYRGARSAADLQRVLLLVLGGCLLATLLLTQFHLTRRFRRLLSPALAAATTCAVVACALGWSVLAAQSHDLKVARRDAFDSVVALSQARAMSYDANADESRYLLDPGRRGTYEQSFEDTSQQLLTLPQATLGTYDARLAAALTAYRAHHADLRFTGYYGDEFRNITFPGERAAAEATVDAYAVYEQDDRKVRTLVRQGQFQQAVAFCVGWDKDASNYDFGQYDTALRKLIGINADAYTGAVAAGRGELTGRLAGAGAAVLAAAGLTVLALRPRLAEFR
ncbi:hypothetical protein OG896_17410 [Streptomyces sp. NBC_00669]|uniref:hypothetical protein n=1 Tax=Streptomyces sp. NBC_00669 TaxID=2976011 RepID=UPI002E34382D|nr:hypothetical protein [Streptomyces sp. NBC_00669]